MFSSCMNRSSSGRPGARLPLRVAVCLLSDCLAVSEPMNETSAYRPLAPSETAKTVTISQRCSPALGGARPGGAGPGGAGPGGAGPGGARPGGACARPAGACAGRGGGSGAADTAEPAEVSSVIVLSITEPEQPNSPLWGETLSSVGKPGTMPVRHL